MDHTDHVNLLRAGIPSPGGVWADLGSGRGAFTLALADLLGPGAVIYSVDRDGRSLQEQERVMKARFPAVVVHYRVGDFTTLLPLPPLDGVVMANALHFVPYDDQEAVVRLVKGYLKPGGRLIIVEYDAERGNLWVPHPLSYSAWEKLARRAGFDHTEKLASRPSSFLRAIYSVVNW